MVSSTPAPLRNPSISYAERAKKAQTAKPPNNTLRGAPPEAQTPAPRSASSDVASASRTAASSAVTHPGTRESSYGSRPNAPSGAGRNTDASSANTTNDTPVPSSSSSSVAQASSPTNPSVLKGPPVINVWTERIKEQKAQAQARAQMSEGAQQLPPRSLPKTGVASLPSLAQNDSALAPMHPPTHPVPSSQASTSTSSTSTSGYRNGTLDQKDDHDPFVVRVPPHLSRSSSGANLLPITPASDLNGWPEVGKSRIAVQSSRHPTCQRAPSSSGSRGHVDDSSPYRSSAPSRKNSNNSLRHHSFSRPGSGHLSRMPSKNHLETHSQPSHSESQSRIQSRSGSSASSPRLQMRGRRLPDDDGGQESRFDHAQRMSSYSRVSPGLGNRSRCPPNLYPNGSVTSAPDASFYRQPSLQPPLMELGHHPHYHAHNLVQHHYILSSPGYSNHIPGHVSPPYTGTGPPGTPPYPPYAPYPQYVYGNPAGFWNDVSPSGQHLTYFASHPGVAPTHISPPEPSGSNSFDSGTQLPEHQSVGMADKPALDAQVVRLENTRQSSLNTLQYSSQSTGLDKPSRGVVFGTIDVTEPLDNTNNPDPGNANVCADNVAQTTDQLANLYIGVFPDEPAPSRLASRQAPARSLSKSQQTTPSSGHMQDGTEALPSTDLSKKSHDDRSDRFPQQNSEVNGSKSHVKWKFGTTHCDDLHDDPLPQCQRNHASEESNLHTAAEHKGVSGTQSIPLRPLTLIPTAPNGHHWPVNTTPIDTSQPGSSILNSEDGSATSDVWEVKDFGFGFGDVSGCGNAQNIARWEMLHREEERLRESRRERVLRMEHPRERGRGWQGHGSQQGWRSENGVEDGRGSWEQVSRPFTRPRRGSYPGYDRGYAGRRGRGFGGRYHGGRGRGSFPHQRLGSLPYAPMQQDTIPPAVDVTKEYAHIPTYAFQETTPAPAQLNARPAVPLPLPASFPLDVTRSHLLGQLEYYLSPQNLAQDYFLRQQMDNKGWIPISLLGSFNRVKYLTTDMDLVKEVLNSSSSVEVNGDWVRMAGRQWEQFILPHAGKSVVEQDETPSDNHGVEVSVSLDSREHEEEIEDCDAEDDEDEDIVFVIGEEAEESWMPERKQS